MVHVTFRCYIQVPLQLHLRTIIVYHLVTLKSQPCTIVTSEDLRSHIQVSHLSIII